MTSLACTVDKPALPLLLVEDDYLTGRALRHMLERVGHRVVQKESMQGAFEEARSAQQRFGAVLLDYCLPDGYAPEACHQLRRIPATAQTPILVVTSSEREDTLRACLAAGASDFLRKPVRPVELHARLARALEHYHSGIVLAEGQRMSAIRLLVGAMAHEVNNPLCALQSFLSILVERGMLPPGSDVFLGELDRIRSVVAVLREVALASEVEPGLTSLSEVLDLASRVVRHRLCGRIELQQDLEACAPVWCHRGLVCQALLCLLAGLLERAEARGEGKIRVALGNYPAGVQIVLREQTFQSTLDPSFAQSLALAEWLLSEQGAELVMADQDILIRFSHDQQRSDPL